MTEPYRFRECSPMVQAFKNRYWYTKDITVVLPPGFTGTKTEIAHCVLVLGCLVEAIESGVLRAGVYPEPNVLLKDVYGPDKEPLADDARRAFHHYKDDMSIQTLGWIEWLLLSLYYDGVKRGDAIPPREFALADLAADIKTAEK